MVTYTLDRHEPWIMFAYVDGLEPLESFGVIGHQLDSHLTLNAVGFRDAADRQKMRLGRWFYGASIR